MTPQKILLIQGHPDPLIAHLCHALEDAYAQGAASAGHAVRRVAVAQLDFPLLRSQVAWEGDTLPPVLLPAQQDMAWATHLVFFFPLWLGDMPALLYRWYFRAHSVKSLERNVLGFVGMSPIHETLVGTVDKLDEAGFKKWQAKLHQLGVAAQ